MGKQYQQFVKLETPLRCGLPDCPKTTLDTFVETGRAGRYNTIELVPYCDEHLDELTTRWQERYGMRPSRRRKKENP